MLGASLIATAMARPTPGWAQSGEDIVAIRGQIAAQYAIWGKAQLTADRATFDRMLAPEFVVRVRGRVITRADFLAQVTQPTTRNNGPASGRPPASGPSRFDSQILTLTPDPTGWVAVITEKIETEATPPDGKPVHAYTLGITRDGWRKDGDHWVVTFSEAVGTQTWFGAKPPFADWDR